MRYTLWYNSFTYSTWNEMFWNDKKDKCVHISLSFVVAPSKVTTSNYACINLYNSK